MATQQQNARFTLTAASRPLQHNLAPHLNASVLAPRQLATSMSSMTGQTMHLATGLDELKKTAGVQQL